MEPSDFIVRIEYPEQIKIVLRDLVRGWADPLLNSNPRERIKLKNRYNALNFNIYQGESTNLHHSVSLDNNCVIGIGTEIGENSLIHSSQIGSNCKIGKNVKIKDSVIFDDVIVEDNADINFSLVGERSEIIEGSVLNEIITGVLG